ELVGGGGYPVAVQGGFRSKSELCIWTMGSGKLRFTLKDVHPGISCLAFSPDGQTLATGGAGPLREDRTSSWVPSDLRLWDVRTGALRCGIEGKGGGGRTDSLGRSPGGGTASTV